MLASNPLHHLVPRDGVTVRAYTLGLYRHRASKQRPMPQEPMTRVRLLLALPVVLFLAGGTNASAADVKPAAPAMAPGVKGGIAWVRPNDYTSYEAVWSDKRVAAGPRGGPASASFERQADGTWKTGVTVLEVKGSRLIAGKVDVTFTRLPDGFSLTGTFFNDNVSLVVDSKGARTRQFRYVRNEKGAYVSVDVPGNYVLLEGEAARLEDPKWPEVALAALAARWGVDAGPWALNPVPPDLTRGARPDKTP